MVKKSVILVTQARIGSTRLNAKVLAKIGKYSLLELHLRRIKNSKNISDIIVATTNEEGSDKITAIANKLNLKIFKGSINDVLDRFYNAVKDYQPEYVVRVTSDCPLIDSNLIDHVVEEAIKGDYDYCSNTLVETYPDGQDIEVIKFGALEYAWKFAKLKSEREHVTPFIKNNSFSFGGNIFNSKSVVCNYNFSKVRMTVDELADLRAVRLLVKALGIMCGWKVYTNYIIENQNLFKNQFIIRNEGYSKSLLKD